MIKMPVLTFGTFQKLVKKFTRSIIIFSFSYPFYSQAQNDNINERKAKIASILDKTQKLRSRQKRKSMLEWINSKAYAASIDRETEKKMLRKRWKKMLGIDVFYPYFKAKEVEKWVKDKASIKVFKIKGRPELKEDYIKYIFKIKF